MFHNTVHHQAPISASEPIADSQPVAAGGPIGQSGAGGPVMSNSPHHRDIAVTRVILPEQAAPVAGRTAAHGIPPGGIPASRAPGHVGFAPPANAGGRILPPHIAVERLHAHGPRPRNYRIVSNDPVTAVASLDWLRSLLADRYRVDGFDPNCPLSLMGAWRGVDLASGAPVAFAVRHGPVKHHAEQFELKPQVVSGTHPSVIPPRNLIDFADFGTLFVFDALPDGTLTLRQFLRTMVRDASEDLAGALFAPLLSAVAFLDQRQELPAYARIDIDTILVFPDGTVRLIHPAMTLHGDYIGHFHTHRKLEMRLKKVEAKAAKGDEAAAQEQTQLFQRFIIADLSIVLYEIMTRKLAEPSRRKMVHDAKKMQKREVYSAELTDLLLGLLEAGRTLKHSTIPLHDFLDRPVIQRYLGERNPALAGGDRGVIHEQVQAARRHRRVRGSSQEQRANRARMVRGEGQKLSPLRTYPLEKKNGVRIDVPLHSTSETIEQLRKQVFVAGADQQQRRAEVRG